MAPPFTARPLSPKGTWRTYTTADGLAGLKTEHIAEDAEGYLWIGTWDSGVCRFDGDEFRTFTTRDGLPSNRVPAVLLDRQGRLWFGTQRGVCWYDGKEFHRLGSEDSVSGKSISFLFEDREGRLWFGGSEALGYVDGTRVCDLVPDYVQQYGELPCGPGQCFGIAQDREGSLWFSFIIHSNLVRYDGERFHRYGQEHGLPVNAWYTVAQDAEGGVWVGDGGILYRYEGQKFQSVPIEIKGLIRKIQPDREGRIWICTAGGGVFCHEGAQFHHFTFQDGLAYDWVNAVFQDREGQLWFATWGGGLSCYDPQSIQVLNEKEGLPFNTVATLTEDHRGRIWMGFTVIGAGPVEPSKFISCYDGEHLETLGEKEGLDRCLTLCADARNRLWSGGYGLQQYEGGRFRKAEMGEGQEHILVSALAEDGEGVLFLGRWKEGSTWQKIDERPLQISRYDGQKFQTLLTREKIHRTTYISALVPTRQGELWFGLGTMNNVGPGEGLGHWRDGEDVRYYTVEDGLVDNRVTDLSEDQRGHLWIATHGGLSCFDGTDFRNYTVADGLPSNHVHSVCEDRQGRLWFGAEGGVALYEGQVFQTLRVPEALSVNDILQDRQGRFWFATLNGLVRYLPSRVPPRVRILQVVAGQVHEQAQEVEAFDSTRQVVFEYKGLSFRTSPKDMLYTYRLVGREEEWQKPTRSLRALYQDLPLGEYTFEVRAIDRDLNYSEPASVRLKVIPDPRDARIDELEQRVRERTRELEEKNRALVVEAALERVRGKALGMQRGEDLQQVSAALFQEFEGLGFPLHRSSIVIVDEAKDTLEAWPITKSYEGLPVLRGSLREVLARLPFIWKNFEAWKEQRPFSVAEQTREEMIEILHASIEVYKIPDEFHESMWRAVPEHRVVHAVFFSCGWLLFMTTDQFPEEALAIACRFAEAFNFAYTRLDLQQAEARTREAQVEAALERVRGKAMGMQQSEDLAGVAAAVFQELGDLGFHLWRCGIGIIDEESDPPMAKMWVTTVEGKAIQTAGKVPLIGHPTWEALYAAWKRKDAHFSIEFAGEDLTSFARYNIEHMPVTEWRSWSADALPTRVIYYDAFFSQGWLFAAVLAPLPQEELGVLQRFAATFSLAYTRFLDLQQAEERARQASRQAAVDRVRAEIASMRTSADLERVTPLLRKELTGLSVPFSRCGVFIVDETVQLVNAYLTNPRGVPLASLSLPFDSHDHIRDIVDHWRVREVYSKQRDQQEFLRWTDFLQGQGHIERERYLDAGAPPETLTAQFVPFTQGMLYVGSAAPLPEEDVALVKDLASAFSIAYARYLDFQQLEEQNRALEQANIQVQEANQHKSIFLARMSHDLRTPMNAIIGYTRILLRKLQGDIDERQYRNLENIHLSADHLLSLINDILDLTRIEAGRIDLKPELVDLRKLVAQCAASVESLLKPGVELKQEIADLAPLHTDADRLNRVLMNLLSNAVKFTQKGRITVSVKPAEGWVELSVADTGIGIPAEDLPSIFEDFRQSGRQGEGEKQGSGLGLAIAERSVELLGGTIAVESQLGKGTKFTVRLKEVLP